MMKKLKVFISSVQKEFAEERKELANYLRNDTLLSSFFEPFLFEETAASTFSPATVYLNEVKKSDIYLALLGVDYGFEDVEGISPTEREYDHAKKSGVNRWIFIKGDYQIKRHIKEAAFIEKVEKDVSRKRFNSIDSLKTAVYNACVLYLKQIGKIESSNFDESLNTEASLKDISDELIREFVRLAREKRGFPLPESATVKQVLTHLNMYRNQRLVNSTLLVFGKQPQLFFPSAIVKCAHFHGFEVEKPIPDFKEFRGTVYNMSHQATDFVLSKLSLSTGTRETDNRVATRYEIPRRMIAEAIINAVAHRDYLSNGSVQVSIFKNRVEIWNPGSLSPELDLERLTTQHGSFPTNPLLADALFQTGDIERYGTGTLEMISLAKKHNLKQPEFLLDEGFRIILWRPEPKSTQSANLLGKEQVGEQEREQVGEQVKTLVLNIQNEMSLQDIMKVLGLKGRRNFFEKHLQPAIYHGFIEMSIPENPTAKTQTYRLTDKGIMLKSEFSKALQEETTDQATEQPTEQPTEQVKRLIRVLSGELARHEIMDRLDLKHRPSFLYTYIMPAIEGGWIEMTIPDNPNDPNQKYRLTPKGQAFKHNLNKKK